MNDNQKIGAGLVGMGFFFFLLGILLLLDRALLVMSNILLLMGILILMSPSGFVKFVIQPSKIQGSIAFVLGVLLVLFKLPLPGIICEIAGAYWLFGGFAPLIFSILLRIPHLVEYLPFLASVRPEESLPM